MCCEDSGHHGAERHVVVNVVSESEEEGINQIREILHTLVTSRYLVDLVWYRRHRFYCMQSVLWVAFAYNAW